MISELRDIPHSYRLRLANSQRSNTYLAFKETQTLLVLLLSTTRFRYSSGMGVSPGCLLEGKYTKWISLLFSVRKSSTIIISFKFSLEFSCTSFSTSLHRLLLRLWHGTLVHGSLSSHMTCCCIINYRTIPVTCLLPFLWLWISDLVYKCTMRSWKNIHPHSLQKIRCNYSVDDAVR